MAHREPPQPRNWWGPLWPVGEALRFLTILPVPGMPPTPEHGLARAIACFPVAGAVIGVVLGLAGWLAGHFWGPATHAALVVVAWGVLTAGLHLDGLSDTFDAVMSWRPRERKLEIMRDSRIGAMGALALVAVLGLKAILLAEAGDAWLAGVLAAPVVGRWASAYAIWRFPAAREGGLGHSFREQIGPRDLIAATATAAALALLMAGPRGLIALGLAWAIAHLLGRWWTRDLGGLTGDTYGALCEIAEVVALATIMAHYR
jgi:adenosylcobinamide-GDP ribazoletransferase